MARITGLGPLVFIFGAVILIVVLNNNPQFKTMISGLWQKLMQRMGGTGGTGQQQQQQQVTPPVQAQQPVQQGITPANTTQPGDVLKGTNPFRGQSTGPGTRSQDPLTRALNDCAGLVGQPYLDCVNAAYPKKRASIASIMIA